MEKVQIRRQYRYDDGNKEKLAANKGRFDWDLKPIEDKTVDGKIGDGVYVITCSACEAKKAVAYETIDIPTTEHEAREAFNNLSPDNKVSVLAFAKEEKAKQGLTNSLMENPKFVSPEKLAKRLEKKQATAGKLITEFVSEYTMKGQYPPQEAFNKRLTEIHKELGLELPKAVG